MNKRLGLFKSPRDNNEYVITSFLKDKPLPPAQDYTSKMTPVRNQQNEGSCVGFAMVVGVKEFQEQQDYTKFIELSPRFLYEAAKKISGHKEGTTLSAALTVAHKLGVCEERFWPYKPQNVGNPSPEAYPNALRYKVATYARITNIDELKAAICAFGPSIIGVKVYKGMMSEGCRKTGIVPNPSCFDGLNVLGGHALCAVGYEEKSPYFKDGHVKVKNSWGDYGDKGYLYLSYAYLNKNMLDAYSCVDIDDPKPYEITRVKNIRRKNHPWI